MWIAHWWGNGDSPTIFFPFVAFWGGLAQFIAGIEGFKARDVLVTVINTMWGAFWMSAGVMWLLNATGTLQAQSIDAHFPELASWFAVVAAFTWVGAFAATARDVILASLLACLATGSTIALCLFSYGGGVRAGMKAAAYFWIISSILAWWRVTVYLVEEAFGPKSKVASFFPVFRLPKEKSAPLVVPGLGEPGVKRGMPGVV
ncbi:GPR1/FUN34/yaaH [Macrophomina phaseolina MS6]|uniref:GPR1/FUN34/yaaH n=2 Tax=Macrophomina phaseolina TaxID=35725 RepID=K2RXR4_MACPH|nr:GPR1/FUN34/yaaH [Macrophomina phaseolina MS6]